MSNSVDPDETAHYEPSHLDLCCLQKPIIVACGSDRVNTLKTSDSEYPDGPLSWEGGGGGVVGEGEVGGVTSYIWHSTDVRVE